MNLVVYNMNEIAARNLLAMTKREDMNVVKDFPCVGRVHIESAYFREDFVAGGCLHVPYLEVNGVVNDFFIETNNDPSLPSEFPCGTSELSLSSPIPVRYHWSLNDEELGKLYSKGLGHPGFKAPVIMENNDIEFNIKINFVGVYDTPVCCVEVPNADNLFTSTFENHYIDLFDMCEEHPMTVYQREHMGQINTMYDDTYVREQEADHLGDEYVTRTMPTPSVEEPVAAPTEDDKISEVLRQNNDKMIKDSVEDHAQRIINKPDVSKIDDFLASVRDAAKEQIDAQNEQDSQDLFIVNQNFGDSKISYDAIRKKAEEDADKQKQLARQDDIRRDLEAFNAGLDDVAGQGSVDVKTAKANKEEKEHIERARKLDVALDNMALNNGATDISGQASASNVTSKNAAPTAQSLLAGIMAPKKDASSLGIETKPSTPSSGGPQYL